MLRPPRHGPRADRSKTPSHAARDQQFFETFNAPNAAVGVRFGGEWFLSRTFPSFPFKNVALYASADLAAPVVSRKIRFRHGGQWVPSFPTAAVVGGLRLLFGADPSR